MVATSTLPPEIRARIERTEERVKSMRSIADLEVTTETIPWMLSKLGEGGYNAKVSCTGFSSFDRTLDLRDLGVRLPPEAAKLVKGTKIASVPPRFVGGFTSAQATAYDAVRTSPYDLDLTIAYNGSGWRYIPWALHPIVESLIQKASAQLTAAKGKILGERDVARGEYEKMLVLMAEDSLDTITKKMGSLFKEDPTFFKTRLISHGLAEFDRVLSSIPSIGFKLYARPITLSVEILEIQARESELESEMTERQRELAAKERARQIKIREKEQAVAQRLAAQRAELDKDREVKERVRQLQLATAREEAEAMLNPFRQGFAQLRARVYADLKDVRDNLMEKGSLAPATATKLANVFETFRALKFNDDAELEELLESVTMMASVTGRGRDMATPQVLSMLNAVVGMTEQSLVEATASGRAERLAL